MSSIAIIPARSGSKGLLNKNIKLLNNKPLIAYTIEAAINSNKFDEIMVSTDSEAYAKIAIDYGAKVPFLRAQALAEDKSSSWDVVKDVLNNYRIQFNLEFDNVALLQPTSPLRDGKDIINAFNILTNKQAQAVISVSEAEYSPLLMNTLPSSDSLNNFILQSNSNKPRQELDSYYRLNGAIYLLRVEFLFNNMNLYGPNSYAIRMDNVNSIDIDTELDFKFAEYIIKTR